MTRRVSERAFGDTVRRYRTSGDLPDGFVGA